MGNSLVYLVLPKCVATILIKLDGFLNINCKIDSILIFYGMQMSMYIKYIGNNDKLIGILCKAL